MIEVERELLEVLLEIANNNWNSFKQACLKYGLNEGEIEEKIINLEEQMEE